MAQTTTMTLTEFLEARLAEDEAVARTAEVDRDGSWISAEKILDCGMDEEAGEQVARWSPARVLREVEAKRAIVALYAEELAEDERGGYLRRLKMSDSDFGRVLDAQRALGHLAAIYSDHPDYREDWKL